MVALMGAEPQSAQPVLILWKSIRAWHAPWITSCARSRDSGFFVSFGCYDDQN